MSALIEIRRMPRLLALGAVASIALAGCERPPIEAEQTGYRGTAIVEINNPRSEVAAVEIPASLPPVPAGGPKAGDVYQNVQVLGDLSIAEFTRTMAAITSWVSPEEGCNYCHAPENLASDDVYTKVVSRRMLQMTRQINGEWSDHVGSTGVSCMSCHGGKPVPANIWFEDNSEATASAFAGNRAGQNIASEAVAYTSLPSDPFSALLTQKDVENVRVQMASYPSDGSPSIQDTERTYGLMMHMSDSLGVNCTYCHNTASFGNWTQSSPLRATAYHGIQMVRELNQDYLMPLKPAYPDNRLGPAGDAPKANCATCHAGQNKPLGGATIAADYPALWTD